MGEHGARTLHQVHASCDGDIVTIRLGNRSPIRADRGGVYAIVGADAATLSRQGRIADDQRLSTSLDMSHLPLFQMTAGRQCQALPVGDWFDASQRGRDGGVLLIVGPSQEVVLYAGSDRPLVPSWPHVGRHAWQDVVATTIDGAQAIAALPEPERATAVRLRAAHPHVVRLRTRVRLEAGDRAGVQCGCLAACRPD